MTEEERKDRIHHHMYETCEGIAEHAERIVRLEEENEKLRELAGEAVYLIQSESPDCGLCKHYDECWAGEATDYSPSGCVICNKARELGIEVH